MSPRCIPIRSGAIHPVLQNIGPGIDGERFALWPVKADGSMYVDADLPATIYAWKCGTPTDGVFPMRLLPGSCRARGELVLGRALATTRSGRRRLRGTRR